jgi:phenylacetate-CoA ligase
MNGASHIREAQIVQRQLDEIVMRIVRADGFGPRDEEVIRYETRNRLGAAMRVRLEYMDTLPRTPRGKLRFVVSELPNDPR